MNTLTIKPPDRYGRLPVEVRGPGGELVASECQRFDRDPQYAKAAGLLAVDKAWLVAAVDQFRRDGAAEPRTLDVPPAGGPPAVASVTLRGTYQPASDGREIEGPTPLDALKAAVAVSDHPAVEPLIVWRDTDALAVLDVDLHQVPFDRRPGEFDWTARAETLTPRPSGYWMTHGRGLRLVYVEAAGLTAEEWCAVAAVRLAGVEPLATCEIKGDTRHPGYPRKGQTAGAVAWTTQTADVSALALWTGRRECDDAEAAAWLAERGMRPGEKYPHDRCPIDPGHVSGGDDPVRVLGGGIYCHSCAGRGLTRGSRTPGTVPFSYLVGGFVGSAVGACIRALTHWEHARYVVAEHLGFSGRVAQLAYSAALKIHHPGDPRIPGVFSSGGNLVRFENRWVNLFGQSYKKDIRPILATLPACQVPADDGAKTSQELVARLDQPTDLAAYGYHDLTPIWGCRVYSHFLPLRDPNVTPIVLQTAQYRPESMTDFRPVYLPASSRRVSEEAAWALIEECAPGLNRAAVKLLLAAKGCVEGGQGIHPMVFISGPTRSAKSSTVNVAAAIAGDGNTEVTFDPSIERVRQQINEAKEYGSYATFNEFIKDGMHNGKTHLGIMDQILNFTESSTSHKLYVGPVPMGRPPVFVWTDTAVPTSVKQDGQLARRLVHVHLPRKVRWDVALAKTGVHKPRFIRSDARYTHACNVILSAVIDEFFKSPLIFGDIAGRLGFSLLSESKEAVECEAALKDLFNAACKAPDTSNRYTGRGWKLIDRENPECPLVECWRAVCDESEGKRDGFFESRKASSADWSELVGADVDIEFETRKHGRKLYVRWVSGGRKNYQVNGELLGGSGDGNGGNRTDDAGHGDAWEGEEGPPLDTGATGFDPTTLGADRGEIRFSAIIPPDLLRDLLGVGGG